ncbi:serine/threonine-protein kinase ppk6 [Cordyceps fumosorosea ARSEF 2679]|uniref:Serine/threonine-protein kinase ppk6 n=1 Tax=Cordyceps fumosorosea (strain ARSEF 2679) TaxID=1081104 RepID=A0A167M3M3_CORFA|nr:serine/threonine-protein kinase ppk6 [Cordyceps fumosorosea ARSEF 2679]OAA53877.1 serine/threonine-protein kinase ppk6 [Cordyceps fumosorosea ARSEF 2679]
MSADLFAEFSQGTSGTADSSNFGQDASRSPQQWPSAPSQPAWSAQPVAAAPQTQNVADEDDGWGDFEVAEPSALQSSQTGQTYQQPPPSRTIAWPGSAGAQHSHLQATWDGYSGNTETRSQSTLQSQTHAFSENSTAGTVWDAGNAEALPKPRRKNPVQTHVNDPGVLFDAADFELEDGEFEGESDNEFRELETGRQAAPAIRPAAAPAPPQPSMPSIDLLSLEDTTPPERERRPTNLETSKPGEALRFGATVSANLVPKNSWMQDLDSAQFEKQVAPAKTQSKAKIQPKTQPKTQPKAKVKEPTAPNAWATENNDDEWAAWDDGPSASASASANVINPTPAPSSWDWDSTATVTENTTTASDSSPPPVNVPPPSVLLSLFPELLSSASALFKSTSGQGGSIKEQILSDPKAVQFLQGYILLATTAARIVAGRKHRWHRDKILAKSMSISAAGSKGMKLAGVDKTQAAREDREAADVVAVWREQVGRLRSAVTAANTAAHTNLKVPELSETLSAHTAKMVGTAPKACVICGLKRDERIAKVDFEVEDSFGEWWVEHWGHRACKNFWTEHERSLRQR